MSLATRTAGATTAKAPAPATAPTPTSKLKTMLAAQRELQAMQSDTAAGVRVDTGPTLVQRILTALAPLPAPAAPALAPAAAPSPPPNPATFPQPQALPPQPQPLQAQAAPVNMTSPIPNASGAGAQTGIPPWMTLLSQMPNFGSANTGMGSSGMGGGGPTSLFGGGMPQGQGGMGGMGQGGPMQSPFDPLFFRNLNMGNLMSMASSMRPGMGGMGQGPAGMMGPGAGAQPGASGRIGGSQAPVLQDGQGQGFGQMLQNLMQQLQGGNATRFTNTFGGGGGTSQFPFAPFLRSGMGFASGMGGGFNPMMGMRGMGGGGMSSGMGGGLGMTGMDPRANDMRQLLLSSLFGGGGGMGGGGGLDVN